MVDLACECHADGSLDHYNCKSFGGQYQYQCKPHIIGQSCCRIVQSIQYTYDILFLINEAFLILIQITISFVFICEPEYFGFVCINMRLRWLKRGLQTTKVSRIVMVRL